MCLIIAFPLKKNFLKVFLQYQFIKNCSLNINNKHFQLFKYNMSVILINNHVTGY